LKETTVSIPPRSPGSVTVVRWVARSFGLCLLLFWGAFFVEHLQWFAHPGQWPPAKVIVLQLVHLTLLAGLVIAWRWELIGSIIALASSIAFFSQTAGTNFLLFSSITSLPAALWLYCYWRTRLESFRSPNA
jgi:hypothetical protein